MSRFQHSIPDSRKDKEGNEMIGNVALHVLHVVLAGLLGSCLAHQVQHLPPPEPWKDGLVENPL